jgi:selenocysteine-specific elongation factor
MATPAAPAFDPSRVLNVNVGILGHVDSGKTSLVAALSTTLSTAALDKHPQSRERGASSRAPPPPAAESSSSFLSFFSPLIQVHQILVVGMFYMYILSPFSFLGITLDLGFSSFTVPLPEALSGRPYDALQFTLVGGPRSRT